jgi:hypothetical protein
VSNAINAGGKKSGLGENSNQSDGKGENK